MKIELDVLIIECIVRVSIQPTLVIDNLKVGPPGLVFHLKIFERSAVWFSVDVNHFDGRF